MLVLLCTGPHAIPSCRMPNMQIFGDFDLEKKTRKEDTYTEKLRVDQSFPRQSRLA